MRRPRHYGEIMRKVKYGDCYNFDKTPPLDAVETSWIVEYMLEQIAKVPTGQKYVVDLSFGPDGVPTNDWARWVRTRKAFSRAEFDVTDKPVTRKDVEDFYRDNFSAFVTLPEAVESQSEQPKSNVIEFRRKKK